MNFPRVTFILRGYTQEESKLIAQELENIGNFAIEVTLNTPGAFEIIETLVNMKLENTIIGAGTVCTIDELKEAHQRGASFALSPIMMSEEMLTYCKKNKILSVPGALSPTEIMTMFYLGADIVKVFPASTLGPSYFKALTGPLGKIPLMAVGGVTLKNAKDYFQNNCDFIGIGSGFCDKEDLKNGDFEVLQKNIKFLRDLGEEANNETSH